MMPTARPLFTLHTDKLSAESKCEIINTFWPHIDINVSDLVEEEYAAFLVSICGALQSLRQHADKFVPENLEDLLRIVKEVYMKPGMTRKELTDELQEHYQHAKREDLGRSIELAVRLWLGVNICSRTLSVGPQNARDTRVEWLEDNTIIEAINVQFQGRVKVQNASLDPSLTAVNLRDICRLHIRWTSSLADHLRLEGPRGRRSLSIYRHRICIVNHYSASPTRVFRKDMLEETNRTLELLFPVGDPKTKALLEDDKVQMWFASLSGPLQVMELDDFKYWRSNLAQLSNLLNGPPETITQTLLDTRNLSQFITLWVAIFGFFVLTVLFGILTTVYSIKQYRIALKSYELSLAVACQQASAPIPGFCD